LNLTTTPDRQWTLIICRRYAEIAEHGRHTPLWAAKHRPLRTGSGAAGTRRAK
jgi:hypothetical protein